MRPACPSHVWRTRDGREIPIEEMEDGHVLNTIRFLHRNAEMIRFGYFVRVYWSSPQPNGDGAQMAVDEECQRWAQLCDVDMLKRAVPQYVMLLLEATKRGLNVATVIPLEATKERP